MAGQALTVLVGLSAYSSSSGGRIAALKTRSLILVSCRKFQNDFREISRGKTGYIDDVLARAMTLLSDKRPLVGTSGSRKAMVGRGSLSHRARARARARARMF